MKSLIKNKSSLYLVLGFLMFCMLCGPACADYNYNGSSLDTIKNGTVKGDVYVSCGDNFGLVALINNTVAPQTFVTNFTNVPSGNAIKWAELKIGVWGGTRTYKGWVNTTLSNASSDMVLGNETLNWTASPFPSNIQACGNGVWLVCYNLTDPNSSLAALNSSSIKATVNTNQIDAKFDGRIYGVSLIVVYENGTCYTQYWINQGLDNLHKNYTVSGTTYPHKDADITWFNGTAHDPCPLGNTSLTVGYLAGDYNQTDYLHFNAPYASDSPYYTFSNADWNKTKYIDWQVGDDVADNMSNNTTHYNFDLKTFSADENNTFNIKDRLSHPDNNYAIFWRAHNSTGTIYDPAWPGVGDGESYYSPFLAVLNTTRITTYDFSEDTAGRAGVDLFAYRYQNNSRAPITNDVPSTVFAPAEYNNIKADDGTFQSDVTTTDGNFAAHRFVFNASCCSNASNFDAFNVTWNGIGYHDAGDTSDGAYIYIWNFNTNAYDPLVNCDGVGTEQTLTGEITANLNNYISNGQIIVLAEQKTAQTDARTLSHIETDYIKLLLKPKA